MPEEFEGDLAGAVFWGADLHGATFRDVDLTGARISHAWFVDVEIDALVDQLVVNGVDVTAYVNERDAWYPLRAMIRPSDPEDSETCMDDCRPHRRNVAPRSCITHPGILRRAWLCRCYLAAPGRLIRRWRRRRRS